MADDVMDVPAVDGGGILTVLEPAVVESIPYDWHTDIHPDVKEDKVWESVPDIKSLTKGYADAVKYNVGALKLPSDDAPAEEWNRVWEKLGRPAAPEGYKIPEGNPALNDLRAVAHTAGISVKQWDTLMEGYSRTTEGELKRRQDAAKVTTEALLAEWGAAHPQKMGMIQQLIRRYGGDEVFEEYNRSGVGNHLPTIQMFAKIAKDLEDEDFLTAAIPGIVTKDAALAEIKTLTNSKEYLNPREPGHAAAVEKATKLFEMAYN